MTLTYFLPAFLPIQLLNELRVQGQQPQGYRFDFVPEKEENNEISFTSLSFYKANKNKHVQSVDTQPYHNVF